MSLPISQFYPLLLVLWAMLFWSRSNVFRATLLISLALHSIFFVRVGGLRTPDEKPDQILSFTFVQGVDETPPFRGEEKVGLPAEISEPTQRPALKEPGEERPAQPDKKRTPPTGQRVEKDLPRIEDISLLDFSANPLAESYRRYLQQLIRLYQRTPPELHEMGFEGRVKVWFNLSRDGKLNPPIFVDPKIRSSHDTVNEAAIDSVVAASQHFPPLPKHVNRAEMWFYVYVDFTNVRFSGD